MAFAFGHGLFEHIFDLAVDAAQFALRPGLQFGPERWINSQQEGFSRDHRSRI